MIRVLVIGDAERDEMRPIVQWLYERLSVGTLRWEGEVRGLRSASEWTDLDWIIALESHPDEYAVEDVYALFAAAPLARIVCCAGSWSESAGRTRKIWPLALRVPATHAIPRLEREWTLLTKAQTDRYLPATGSREEWFAAHHPPISCPLAPASSERGKSTTDSHLVQIVSPDAAYRQMLADCLAMSGLSVTTSSDPAAMIVLFDADPWTPQRQSDLRQLQQSALVIAVTDWSIPEFIKELTQAGAQRVLPKLGDQNQILRAVAEL